MIKQWVHDRPELPRLSLLARARQEDRNRLNDLERDVSSLRDLALFGLGQHLGDELPKSLDTAPSLGTLDDGENVRQGTGDCLLVTACLIGLHEMPVSLRGEKNTAIGGQNLAYPPAPR